MTWTYENIYGLQQAVCILERQTPILLQMQQHWQMQLLSALPIPAPPRPNNNIMILTTSAASSSLHLVEYPAPTTMLQVQLALLILLCSAVLSLCSVLCYTQPTLLLSTILQVCSSSMQADSSTRLTSVEMF